MELFMKLIEYRSNFIFNKFLVEENFNLEMKF